MKKHVILLLVFLPLFFNSLSVFADAEKPSISEEEKIVLEQKGYGAFSRGEYEEALAIFGHLHKAFPAVFDYTDDLGLIYLLLGKYDEAEAAYKESLKLVERNPEAHMGLGITYILQGKLKYAAEELELTLDKNPSNIYANLFLGYIYLKDGMPQDALPYFQEVVVAYPDNQQALAALAYATNYEKYKNTAEVGSLNPETLLNYAVEDYLQQVATVQTLQKANALSEERKYPEAIALMLLLQQKHPNNIEYSVLLGNYYAKNLELGKAQRELQRVINIDPENLKARYDLASVYSGQGNTDKAIAELKFVLNRQPDNLAASQKLGDIYLSQGHLEEGRYYYDQILQYRSVKCQDPLYYFYLGNYYAIYDNWEQAEQNYAFALSLDPRGENIRLARARASLRLGNFNVAKADIDYLLDADPNNKDALELLGEFFLREGDYPSAISTYQFILTLPPEPKNIGYLNTLGTYYFLVQQFNQAEDAFKSALTIAPGNAEARLGLANVYQRSGRKDLAKAELEYLLRYDLLPSMIADIKQLLGDINLSEENYETALRLYEQAIRYTPDAFKMVKAYRKGVYYAASYCLTKAEEFFEESLKIFPKFASAQLALASVYASQGKLDKAEGYLLNFIKQHPHDQWHTEVYEMLGDAYTMQGYDKKARQYYAHILSLPPEPNNNQYLLLVARDYMASKQIPLAEKTYNEVLRTDPLNQRARMGLAEVYAMSGKIELAESTYASLLSLPLTPLSRSNVKFALGELYLSRENKPLALNFYEQAIHDTPESFEALREFRKGKYNMAIYQGPTAEMHFKNALAASPKYAAAQIALADVYLSEGRIDELKDYMEVFIEEHPENLSGYIEMGKAFSAEGNNEVASQYNAAILSEPCQPWSPSYFFNLGIYHLRSRRFCESQEAFCKALAIDPCNAEARIGLAQSYTIVKKDECEKCELEKVLSMYPLDFGALLGIGEHYMDKRRYNIATAYIQKTLDQDPSNWSGKRAMKLVDTLVLLRELEHCTEYEEAIAVTEHELIGIYPYDSSYYARLGNYYLTLRQYTDALGAFQEALSLTYNDLDAMVGLANYYIHFGCISRAKSLLNDILCWKYCNADAHLSLGNIYLTEGHLCRAVYHYLWAVNIDPINDGETWVRDTKIELDFIFHDDKIDKLTPNTVQRHVSSLTGLYSKELGKNPFTERFQGVLWTNAWILREFYYLNNKWKLMGTLSQTNERFDNLPNQIKVIEANMYTLSLGADWAVSDNWTIKGSLGGLRGIGHKQQEAIFQLSQTYRFQPSIDVTYESLSFPIHTVNPPPIRKHYINAGFAQDTIMPFFWSEREAHYIDIQHFAGLYEYRFIPPYAAIGVAGEYRNYKDPVRNHYREGVVWVRSAIPWWKDTVDLRGEFNYRSFNTPVREYYSFRRQIEPVFQFSIQKNWCFAWQGQFIYRSSYRLTHDLISPVQTGLALVAFRRQSIHTNSMEAVLTRNFCDRVTFKSRGFFYWDSEDYKVFTALGTLSWNF